MKVETLFVENESRNIVENEGLTGNFILKIRYRRLGISWVGNYESCVQLSETERKLNGLTFLSLIHLSAQSAFLFTQGSVSTALNRKSLKHR